MLGFLTRATRGVDGSAELGGSQKMYFFKKHTFQKCFNVPPKRS